MGFGILENKNNPLEMSKSVRHPCRWVMPGHRLSCNCFVSPLQGDLVLPGRVALVPAFQLQNVGLARRGATGIRHDDNSQLSDGFMAAKHRLQGHVANVGQ